MKSLRVLIGMLLAWITEKRVDYYYKKEDFYRYKRLMAAENDTAAHEELCEFLKEFQVSNIDYLFFWQKTCILAATVIVEIVLAILVTYGVSVLPLSNVNPSIVLVVAALALALLIDLYVVTHLMDKIETGIYYRRMKKMEAKLASEPVV